MKKHPFDPFLDPGSVAVVGASRKTGKGSFNVVERMIEFGFEGMLYPVNPSAREIMGLKAYKQLSDIEDRVDLAVISIPREHIPGTVEECARKGITGAIIIPQGFADADEIGKNLQNQLTQISRHKGIRILGPNTLGVINAYSGFSTSFVPHKREKMPVGVICQSGMFFVGSAVFTGVMGKGIDIGNGCDLDFADALEYFGDDNDIEVIFTHIEGMSQGRRFFQIAQRVARRKPIIALKAARSTEGAKAALSHSGVLVGRPEVFEAAFQQAGITTARESQEVKDFTRAFLRLGAMEGNRIGVVSFTGAGGILLIDALEQNGLRLAELSPHTIERVQALSPAWMSIRNPVDIWPALMKHGMHEVYRVALTGLLQDHGVDGIICLAIAPDLPAQADLNVTEVIGETAAIHGRKPVVSWLYGPNQQGISKTLEASSSVLSFPSLFRASRTLSALHKRGHFLKSAHMAPPYFAFKEGIKEILQGNLQMGNKKIEGVEAKRILEAAGIPVSKCRFCKTLPEILNAAHEIGFPVALKISSSQIIHKTDVGGVALNLDGPADIERAFERISGDVESHSPGSTLEGFLVQEMVESGLEVLFGAKRDAQFGPTILFGSGGIHTEVWQDITYGIAPLTIKDADRMLRGTRCYEILKGVRGKEAFDIDFLVECLLRLSQLIDEVVEINEIDINPFKVFSKGGLALDTRIFLKCLYESEHTY